MASPFLAEIRLVGFGFAPQGWAFCNGYQLPVQQNQALFSLLGTSFGGDGRTSFALPNIHGQGVIGVGQGPGLSGYDVGDQVGTDHVQLADSELPLHSHTVQAAPDPADQPAPAPNESLARSAGGNAYQAGATTGIVPMAAAAVGPAGGADAHNNMPPVLVLNYIIALKGEYPPRP
jgi:microcystin-dependent protein